MRVRLRRSAVSRSLENESGKSKSIEHGMRDMRVNQKTVTLGVRVDESLVRQMDQIYRKFYVDKSKQIRCLLNYFLSLPEDEQKAILDRGMQREIAS